jgi:hypothetical protein
MLRLSAQLALVYPLLQASIRARGPSRSNLPTTNCRQPCTTSGNQSWPVQRLCFASGMDMQEVGGGHGYASASNWGSCHKPPAAVWFTDLSFQAGGPNRRLPITVRHLPALQGSSGTHAGALHGCGMVAHELCALHRADHRDQPGLSTPAPSWADVNNHPLGHSAMYLLLAIICVAIFVCLPFIACCAASALGALAACDRDWQHHVA